MWKLGLIALFALTASARAEKPVPVFCTAIASYAGPELRKAPTALPSDAIDSSKPMPQVVAEKLEARFREGMEFNKARVGAIAIYRGDIGYWSSTVGIASNKSKRFALASITKMATASVIFQLANEKKLSLDNTIDKWFSDLPNARVITIDHLLSHTSGLMSVGAGIDEEKSPNLVRSFYWPSEEWKKWAGGNNFCSGARLEYSNQGYVLLARVAEQLEHASFADIVDRRVVKPLGLKSFGILRAGAEGMLVATGEPNISTWYDFKGKKRSASYPALVAQDPGDSSAFSDVGDMLVFLNGWLTGKLFPPAIRDAALSRMRPLNTAVSHGRGIMMWEVPDTLTPSVWLGHSGGMPGTSTIVIYDVTRDAWLAAAFNIHGVNVNAIANEMLKKLDEVAPRFGK